MLKMELVTKKNLDVALETFGKVFTWIPKGADPYSKIINGENTDLMAHYYLVFDEDEVIGVTGSYTYDEDPDSAFLGWFGILPEMRRKHYGSRVLKMHEDEFKEEGFRYLRYYTDTMNNESARQFFERNGYTFEPYVCEEEPGVPAGTIVVYSKALGDWPLEAWDNKCLYLEDEAKMMYPEEILNEPEKFMKEMKRIAHL